MLEYNRVMVFMMQSFRIVKNRKLQRLNEDLPNERGQIMLTKERTATLIELCRKMVQTPSLSGQESEIAALIKKTMDSWGFDDVVVDKYGSIIGRIKGKKPGKTLLFDGHIDTVDISDRSLWQHDPYGAEVVDGKIFGRGTSDMKGPVSAMIAAAAFFSKDTGKNFAGDVFLSCSVHEECFEGIAAREISKRVNPDYVVIGEASSLKLMRGQRGRAEIVVETIGKTAHSANPQLGKNAVYYMMRVIQAVKEIKLNREEVLGEGILELTDIISDPYPGASVVPNLCRVTYDRRTLTGETKDSVISQVQEAVNTLVKEDPELEARVYFAQGEEKCWTGETIKASRFYPAWLLDEQHELVQTALKGLFSVGLKPELSHWAFCTNGSHFAGEIGIPTIGFGPSHECLAHVIDEYIEVEQLLKGCQGYYGIISELLK